ncbi:MAG: glycosyl transferase [Paracoccaceae bacterium]|nr:glycosyl transferase [Paracoccaceae bacterium]
MTVGFIVLAHTAFHRVEEVARHWATRGCPVVIHIDKTADAQGHDRLCSRLGDLQNVRFSRRHACDWGTWGLVAATLSAADVMLRDFPEVRHVYLASGSCLPLRPVAELKRYLAERPDTDFIESVTTEDVNWTKGGLDAERFTFRFPFSWKRHRRLFDGYVALQRAVGFRRRIPGGLVPHLGSQWWCLTRETLAAILQDPRRPEYDRYFRRVWIPDESYFQTLVRLHARKVESRSLTLSKFDFQGKPHIFYDDHLQLLRRSDCFVARKIWPHADKLYRVFLRDEAKGTAQAEPNPGKIDRLFSRAVDRRTRGRPGLYMQSRFPNDHWENGRTAAMYSVFEGFSDLYEDFETWLAKTVGSRVHGHLFAPDRAEFAGGETIYNGALPDSAALRDYNPRAFLTNLIWNTRGERQCFQFGPADVQKIGAFMARDPNAQISVISGAWAVPLFHSGRDFARLRKEAARLQKIEGRHLAQLRVPQLRARVRIWTMADFVENPMEALQLVVDEINPRGPRRLTEVPRMVDLTGFGRFLQNLKNEGMQPHLMGDFPVDLDPKTPAAPRNHLYVVR